VSMHSDDSDFAAINEAAADWFVRRRDGLPPEAEARYQAWIGADPRHAAAIGELQAAWVAVNFPATVGRGQEAGKTLDRREVFRQRRPFLVATAGLAAAAALVFAFLPQGSLTNVLRPAAAVAVRPNITTLPDGSSVELNKGAEFAFDFTPVRRNIRLLHGEAYFSVAKDAARPFIVSAAGIEIRAVGTAFAVRADPRGVGVLVTEGRVAIQSTGSDMAKPAAGGSLPALPTQPIFLDAGRSVALTTERFSEPPPFVKPVSAEEIGAALAWRGERLEFTRMPLSEVVVLFNKRNRIQLSVSDRAAATIPISGIFWADDSEGFVQLLESGMVVRSERSVDRIILSSR
jgi:transmembrane sensor